MMTFKTAMPVFAALIGLSQFVVSAAALTGAGLKARLENDDRVANAAQSSIRSEFKTLRAENRSRIEAIERDGALSPAEKRRAIEREMIRYQAQRDSARRRAKASLNERLRGGR